MSKKEGSIDVLADKGWCQSSERSEQREVAEDSRWMWSLRCFFGAWSMV